MLATEKLEAENLIQKLPDESTFEDIQYHLYVAGAVACHLFYTHNRWNQSD